MGPSVTVLARHMYDLDAARQFVEDHDSSWRLDPKATEGECLIEFCGRICYMSFGDRQSPRTNREYLANLIRQGHESVFEHLSWTMVLAGVSRAFTHQLVRHRVGFAFSQLSQQYQDQRGSHLVMPPVISSDPRLASLWQKTASSAQSTYTELVESLEDATKSLGMSTRERHRLIRSAARSILPEGVETKIAVTANARAVRHFLSVRGAIPGDEEVRSVSAALLMALEPEAPSVFQDFRLEVLEDGSPLVHRVPLPSPHDPVVPPKQLIGAC